MAESPLYMEIEGGEGLFYFRNMSYEDSDTSYTDRPWIESQNHSLAWVGKDLKDRLVPAPCCGQGQLIIIISSVLLKEIGLEVEKSAS